MVPRSLIEGGLRSVIVSVFVTGIRRRNPGAVTNALISLVGTYLPDILERVTGTELRPWQRLYIQSAMVTHSVGMLGPYDDVWWWDHLTHTHSATIVGSVVHVLARRRKRDPRRDVFLTVVSAGTLWELIEYFIHFGSRRFDLEPVLITYGRDDTLQDLLFNLVGALLVVVFGDRLLGNLVGGDE